jgi:predicted permease
VSATRRSWPAALHALLFRCYPRRFRADFGDEAQRVFEARLSSARAESRRRAAVFAVTALVDVLWSGLAARVDGRRAPRFAPRQILGELKIGVRMLWRSRGSTTLSMTTLGLGIGLTAAAFCVVDAVLLAPLPFADSHRLVRVRGGQAYLDMIDWTAGGSVMFAGVGGYRAQTVDVVDAAGTERLPGALVTGDLFDVVGVRPALGRLIAASDDRPGAEPVAVLSHGLWRRRYGGRADAIGETLATADVRYRIVGVLPAEFFLPLTTADVVVAARPIATEFDFRGVHSLTAIGRLSSGVMLPAAQAAMDAIAVRLEQQYPQSNQDVRFVLQPVDDWLLGDLRMPLLTLFGAIGAFWLIACANVANLQVGRALSRQDEMAVRRAIGASDLRLTRLAFIEQLTLIVPAGVAGAAMAWALLRVLSSFSLDVMPRLDGAAVDLRALLFVAALTGATVLVFGAMPVIAAVGGARATVVSHGERVHRRTRLISALLTAEVAITLMLAIGGGLLLRSYTRLMRVDPGFDTSRLLTFNLTLRPLPRLPPAPPEAAASRTADALAARNSVFRDVTTALAAIPGVDAVAATTDLPIAAGANYHNLVIDGHESTTARPPEIYYRGVSAGFFSALRLPLIDGRDIAADDHAGAPPVVVVNQAFVRSYLSGENAIGRRVRWAAGHAPWMTIVGVAADVRGLGLDADEVPAVYGPAVQDSAVWRRFMDFAVRTSVDPATIAPQVRTAVAAIDPSMPVMRLQSMEALIAQSTAGRRFVLTFLTVFSVAALVLVVAGLSGAVTYAVRMRRAEFGVRLALGAQPRQVVRLALRQAWLSMAVGTAIGLAGAVLSVRAIASLLYQVSERDVLVYAAAALTVAATATVAALVPAVRAGRINPLIVLGRD